MIKKYKRPINGWSRFIQSIIQDWAGSFIHHLVSCITLGL